MIRAVALLGVAHFSRILSNVVLFVVLARLWGPESFGQFMYWFAVSNLIALATDLGAQNYLLAAIGGDREAAQSYFSATFRARLAVTALVVLVAVGFAVFGLDGPRAHLFIVLLGAAFATTFAELQMIPLRALHQLRHEARDTAVISVLAVAGILSVAIVSPGNILAVAWAYLASRIAVLLIARRRRIAHLVGSQLSQVEFSWRRIVPFGLDSMLTNLSANLDSILVQALFGPAGVGLYQAGARLAQGALTFAPVLGGVYLPKLASISVHADSPQGASKLADELRFRMTALGLAGGGVFVAFGPWIVSFLYGPAYEDLASMMSWFGIAVLLRYSAAGVGLLLTAGGAQWLRLTGNCVSVATLAIGSVLLAPMIGVAAVPASLALGNLVLLLIYLLSANGRAVRPNLPSVIFDFGAVATLVGLAVGMTSLVHKGVNL